MGTTTTLLAWKTWLRSRFPRLYRVLALVKGRLCSELSVAAALLRGDFRAKRATEASDWHAVLPLQAPSRVRLEQLHFEKVEHLAAGLEATRNRVESGGHSIYLPPATFAHVAFRPLASRYPADAGLKLLKNPGGVREAAYLRGAEHSALQRALLHDLPRMTLACNLLHIEGIGPRLYDLVEVEVDGRTWTGWVVRHVEGRPPTAEECEAGLGALRSLETRGVVAVVAPGGWANHDFAVPACNGNAWTETSTGAFHYVDFQNFRLTGYGAYLEALAQEAQKATHFGDLSLLRGGRYLYQSVPGLAHAAKRGTEERVAVLARLCESAGVSPSDRLVLDVGCNLGMMLGQYLRLGARWAHGWDMPHVTPHAERMLLALGCTRFSLTACRLEAERALEADLPAHVRAALPGCFVSYLAVRGHVGWLLALQRIPWSTMLYEGHEGETEGDLTRHVAELSARVPVRVVAQSVYVDGDSRRRVVAVLARAGDA